MPDKPTVCMTFVGDVSRNSRGLRCITALQERAHVHLVVLHDAPFDVPEGVELSLHKRKPGSSLKQALIGFWRQGVKTAGMTGASIFLASDLYSLPVAARAARIMKKRLIYDSRELYTAIAALKDRPLTQRFWSFIERLYATRASAIMTVNDSLAGFLRQTYKYKTIGVVHNYPNWPPVQRTDTLRKLLNIPQSQKIILSQGGIQKGRGAFLLVDALEHLPDCRLVFLGGGALQGEVHLYAVGSGLEDRVHFVPAVPVSELPSYTASADVGACMIENHGASYYYSLPNKLFEYIAAGLPVVGSDFPEIAAVITKHKVGLTATPSDPVMVAEAFRQLLTDKDLYYRCTANAKKAAPLFRWEKDKDTFLKMVFGEEVLSSENSTK